MSRLSRPLRLVAMGGLIVGLSAWAGLSPSAAGAAAMQAPGPAIPTVEQVAEMLRKADRTRGGGIGHGVLTFQMTHTRRTAEGERREQAAVRVYLQPSGEQGAKLIVFEEPASLRGSTFLTTGRDTWMYKPGLRSPLRMSVQQRLFGDASVGEAAGLIFSLDYHVRQVSAEDLDGEPTWRVELEAKSPSVPYPRATVWLGQRDGLYRRAVVYSVSGMPLKQLDYEQWGTVSGRFALVRLAVRDLLQVGGASVTVIETRAITERTIPARYFRPEFLSSALLLLGE